MTPLHFKHIHTSYILQNICENSHFPYYYYSFQPATAPPSDPPEHCVTHCAGCWGWAAPWRTAESWGLAPHRSPPGCTAPGAAPPPPAPASPPDWPSAQPEPGPASSPCWGPDPGPGPASAHTHTPTWYQCFYWKLPRKPFHDLVSEQK